MEALQYREKLDIAVAPSLDIEKYYKVVRARYNRMIDPSPVQLPERPADYYIKANSQEAKDLIFNVFRKAKRGYGHG